MAQETSALILKNITKIVKESRLAQLILGISGFSVLRYGYLSMYRRYHKLPPGPVGLPYLGVTPAMVVHILSNKKYFGYFGSKWRFCQYYGGIYSLFNKSEVVVEISDAKLVQKILKNKNALDRPKGFRDNHGLFGDPAEKKSSFVQLNGQDWAIRRKFAQTALSKVSTNKFMDSVISGIMEDTIYPAFNKIINKEKNVIGNELDSDNAGLLYPRKFCGFIAFRTIFHSNFGVKIDFEDTSHKELTGVTDDLIKKFWPFLRTILLDLVKVTRKLPFMKNPYVDWTERRNRIINDLIERRLKSKDYDENNPKGYIDHVIHLEKEGKLTRKETILDIYLFFMAGSETTANNLEHGITYLAKNTEIQDRVRKQLLTVFKEKNKNGYKEFKLNQWKECPLHRALVYEILRVSTVVPDGVAHCAQKDIAIEYKNNNYIIPKGATIQYNEYVIHKISQTEKWKSNDTTSLHLENWLSEDKQTGEMTFVHNDSDVTFGLGRRDCIGKHLAVKEMASVLGHLLLNYRFSLGDKKDENFGQTYIGLTRLKKQVGIKIERIQ